MGGFLQLEEAGLEEGNPAPRQTPPFVLPKRSLLPELVALSLALALESPEQVTVWALAQESHDGQKGLGPLMAGQTRLRLLADARSQAAVASEAEDLEAWLVVARMPVCSQIQLLLDLAA